MPPISHNFNKTKEIHSYRQSDWRGMPCRNEKLMDLRNGEKLQAIAPVVSQAEEEAQTAEGSAEKS